MSEKDGEMAEVGVAEVQDLVPGTEAVDTVVAVVNGKSNEKQEKTKAKGKPKPQANALAAGEDAELKRILEKRIRMFEEIQLQQKMRLMEIGGEGIRITLPDGTVKEGKKWITSPMDIAKEISKGLAENALISEVNGVLWDMTRPLENDCTLKLFTFDTNEGRDTFWHSSAHILGQVQSSCSAGCTMYIFEDIL